MGSANTEPGILLDSGSCLNACPPDFAPTTPLLPIHEGVQAYAFNGQPIRVVGAKKIRLRLESGYLLDLLFIVMNVSRPLISVGQLNKYGFMVDFGKKGTVRQGGIALPVVEHSGLFYLAAAPVTMIASLLRTTRSAETATTLAGAATATTTTATAARAPTTPLHLVEWCCELDSRLSGYFAARGSSVTRLHLLHDDMRLDSNAAKVLEEIKQRLRLGVDVIVWAALPCTAWSGWKRVNAAAGGVTAAAVEAARRESQVILRQLQTVLQCAYAGAQANPSGGVLHAAFDWPRAAYVTAGEVPELQAILRSLPWKCQFDGCMYGLRAKSGILMQKPWTVYTTMPEMEAVLHKRRDR